MANIHDVAKRAGVSVTTVSRVLNNHPYVTKEKVTAVQKAIDETGYSQNINAIHLKKGKTSLVGVVLPFIDHPYFSALVHGITQEAATNRYKLVLFQTDYHEDEELEALEMLKHKQIDSLIICSRRLPLAKIEAYHQYGPITLFENAEKTRLSCCYVDHAGSFTMALSYLYDQGHRNIAYSLNRLDGANSQAREQAYRDFLNQKSLVDQANAPYTNCLTMEDGMRVAASLLDQQDPPTAILATSDQVAAGILTACLNRGIQVPTDLAIIGTDNQPIAAAMDLTTIHIPLHDIGKHLFNQTQTNTRASQAFQTALIKRRTT